jgi:hypothetical protein
LGDVLPASKGIYAGLNEKGVEVYVGRASYDGQLAPAKLMISGNPMGLFFPYGGLEIKITSGIEYYEKEHGCIYSWVSSSNGQVVKNAVEVRSDPYTFYVGRTTSYNSVQVGKVIYSWTQGLCYAFNGKEECTSTYEVLVCKFLGNWE